METLSSTQVYASPWLTVREDAVRRPDGSTGTYGVVDGPDIALAVPVDGERLHLVEQYRYPVGGRRWEFPSGSADGRLDADPRAVAERELREETGLVAGTMTLLGTIEVTPSTMSQRCSVYLAEALVEGQHDREVAEQDLRSAWFSRADVERMIIDGTICDAKSVAAFTLLLLRERAGLV